ncbi:nitroreductase family protein [Tichowtungia aerotolerans]|uniref:Nitroreductase n=1 Tax=Tichowtungia aerotolerans TaxID=2697043 RepID=A0A6P1M8W3_9BACT|nr:nitroreductase family protein [Tichowtungia aerotolerans]QHI70462.1 nitroreductase [Tichowtungia aerotolerans]
MKFIELARQRVSIRSYSDRVVSQKMLNEVLEAGQMAPTACNYQPFQFVVVKETENLKALAEAYPADWFAEAPIVIAICTQPKQAWHRKKHDNRCYADVDAAIAADHMTLAAADLGLGTCWIGAFDPKKVRKVLQVPRSAEPLILLTLGHPNETGRPKQRKPMNELVRLENWNNE